VEEETPGGRGAVEVTRSSPPDAVIIGEPTGWDSVVFGYKGKLDLTYRAWRAPSHSSDPSEKATEAVVSFWMRLIELLGPTGPQFDLPSAALCGLDGDTTEARATVACRLPANFDVAGFVHRLRDGASQNELTVENAVAAVRRPRSDPVVRHLSRSVRARGGSPTHRLRGGTSDMNTVAAVWDVPMATYGPGDHTLEHGDQERIELDHYLRAISVLADALDGLGGELAVHHSPTIERIVSA
jgi:[amino group carrier protein]-lysine/ornithine hydrolase